MKLCANISWLFTESPFLARIEAAHRAGFGAIEFHATQGHSAVEIARAAKEAGVRIALFNATPGDFFSGGAGLSGVPGREREFAAAIDQAAELGAAVGGACVQIGQSRIPDGVTRQACLDMFEANLRLAADRLGKAGCRAMVEPMNVLDAPGVLIRNADEAIASIDRAGDSRVGLQFDCYHEHRSGGAVTAAIERWRGRIGHLQFSDSPGRHEPGSGTLDFEAIWALLASSDYDRWVAAEYHPRGSTHDSLEWMRRLQRLGLVTG